MNKPYVGNFRLCLSVFRISFSSSVSGIFILVVPYVHVGDLEYCVITSRFIQVTSQCQNIETKPVITYSD